MPMLVVTHEEYLKEIENGNKGNGILVGKVTDPVVIRRDEPEKQSEKQSEKHRGRSEGDNNVPESLRKLIAEESVLNGRASALELAKSFGISGSSVSAYAKGSTSTASYHTPDAGIAGYIRNRKERLTKRALRTLGSALHEITPEKLTRASAKDCSSIAKDMSAVVKNFDPDKDTVVSNQQNNQFVFYTPVMASADRFETIDVKE